MGAGGQGVRREGGLNDGRRNVTGFYCLVAVAVWYWNPGGTWVGSLVADRAWYAPSLAWRLYGEVVLAAFLVAAAIMGRPTPRELAGRALQLRDLVPIGLTVVITFLASGAFITLTMVAVSYLLPSFVTWWLEWSYPFSLYLNVDGSIPLWPNIARLLGVIVITPILEEVLFRGYLLHAWVRKWGLWNGVLFSSAIFGLIHPDTLPAMLTGVGLALLYLRTQSLWAPIFAHSLYNAVVTAWGIWYLAGNGWEYVPPDLDALRSDWWIGLIQLAVVVVLVDQIMRRGALAPLRLPAPAEKLGHAADRGGVHG